MLLGITTQQARGWQLSFSINTVSVPGETPFPLMGESGHLFLHWEPPDINPIEIVNALGREDRPESPQGEPAPTPATKPAYFTPKELHKIHARGGHPHWWRMLDFLKRMKPSLCPPDVRAQLQKIMAACKACKIYGPLPRRARVAIPHPDGVFGTEIVVD